MKMKAIGNKILVKIHPKEEVTSSGILLIETNKKEKPRFGTVISVGESVKEIKVNDIISFGNYALNNQVKEEYFIMTESDIFGYFRK